MVCFIHLFNYAAGVSVKDGETWYLGKHNECVFGEIPGVSWEEITNLEKLSIISTVPSAEKQGSV